jgi:hypothetical protein
MTRTLLTVDWDFFVPEKPEWDLSHQETMLHIETLWGLRVFGPTNYMEIIKTDGKEINFWDRIGKRFKIKKDTPIFVTESHLEAHSLAHFFKTEKVYSFDSHCDIYYSSDAYALANSETINCGCWLGMLLLERIVKEAVVTYSDHTNEKVQKYGLPGSLRFTKLDNLLDRPPNKQEEISAIHICRSGAWTPPWLDNDFMEFYRKAPGLLAQEDYVKRAWDINEMLKQRKEILEASKAAQKLSTNTTTQGGISA